MENDKNKENIDEKDKKTVHKIKGDRNYQW
jgi:hypothetical protein